MGEVGVGFQLRVCDGGDYRVVGWLGRVPTPGLVKEVTGEPCMCYSI